jgi:hypothetical protein
MQSPQCVFLRYSFSFLRKLGPRALWGFAEIHKQRTATTAFTDKAAPLHHEADPMNALKVS